MANHRKLVREAIVSVLGNSSTGFNFQLADIAQSYGIQPWEFDFGQNSRNVIAGYIDDAGVEVSRIFDFPGMIIYTTEAIHEAKVKPAKFSGFVGAIVTVYLRLQALDAVDLVVNRPDFDSDFEKWPDAVEDALHEALYAGRNLFRTAGCTYSLYRSDRTPIVESGDGHSQSVIFQLGFEVHRQ